MTRIPRLPPLICVLAALVAGPAGAAPFAGLPAPVKTFVARRAECQHWLGEDPYDASRRAQINRAVRRLGCGRLDRDEVTLRRRYRTNAAAIRALDAPPEPL